MQVKEKSKQSKKKSRTRKLEKDDTFFEELAESEAAFFQTVKRVKKNLVVMKKKRSTFHGYKIFSRCCLERVFSRFSWNINDRCYRLECFRLWW